MGWNFAVTCHLEYAAWGDVKEKRNDFFIHEGLVPSEVRNGSGWNGCSCQVFECLFVDNS